MPEDAHVQLDRSFTKLCKRHGWTNFEPELHAVIQATGPATLERNAEFLQMLCTVRDRNSERIELCRRLVEQMVEAVVVCDGKAGPHRGNISPLDRAGLLQHLVMAMFAIRAEEPLNRLIDVGVDRLDGSTLSLPMSNNA